MIRNYFKIAWRNLIKHKLYSGINILGLFTGLTFALFIGSYVWGELRINKDFKNVERQCQLLSEWKDSNMGIDFTTFGPLSKRLKEEYPSLVANYYRMDGISSNVSKDNTSFRESIQLCESTLLSMYDLKLLFGDRKTALINPYSVVITDNIAIKYFGRKNVVGETLTVQNFSDEKRDFIITGVIKEFSKNSVTQSDEDFPASLFIPSTAYKYFNRADLDSWTNIYIPSYIELQKGVSIADLEMPIQKLIDQHVPDYLKENIEKVTPISISDYYLERNNGFVKKMLYNVSFVGLFILLMAIINFINISISTSGSRMREIGVRKVLGGVRSQLIFQFLTESFIMVLLATILAAIVFSTLSVTFGKFVGTVIPDILSFPLTYAITLSILILFISLLAGLYPAFVLSSFKPVNALKQTLKTTKEDSRFRKLLVGFQFSVALMVLVASIIITQQTDFFFGQDLGYNKEFILSSQVPRDWTLEGVQKMETIRNEFETVPEIKNVSLSYTIPDGGFGNQFPIYKIGSDANQAVAMKTLTIDSNYLSTYEIPLKAGTTFDSIINMDSPKALINETAAIAMGWKTPEEAIGQQIKIKEGTFTYTVKGVIKDYHFDSMHKEIQPVIFFNFRTFYAYRYLSFRMHSSNMNAAIVAIQKKWEELLPESSFEYKFMDGTLKKMYAKEIQLKKASYNASLLSLIIVLLGVIGLISLSIHKRIKEIGIRKVIGASVPTIMLLFIKEFLGVVLLACLIACPMSYFIMEGWLNSYVYRIDITAQPFIISIVILMSITILLIGILTLKAARTNPIKSLRTE